MTNLLKLLGVGTLTLVACGDNKERPDAGVRQDSKPADAYCSNCPAAPAIGTTQLDRMGRPAINTALNFTFTDQSMVDAKKDAYNADAMKTGWTTTWTAEFAKNLAFLDVLDGGIQGNGLCETGETHANTPQDCPGTTDVGAVIGCGNQLAINKNGANNLQAYGQLAGVLADDRLYVDTSKTQCTQYLAVELGVVGGSNHTTCGGRSPTYDVIDVTYSALALGTAGFSTDGQMTPVFGDMVSAHTDYLSTFPYLGLPH